MKKLRHPVRTIREPLGIAGLIISVLALVLAVSAGAIAATGALSGKQRKEVEKIAAKYAGTPGATGPVGPGGPVGKDGAGGKDGSGGADGKSVEVGGTATGCPAGGVTVQVAGEPSTAKEICNGADGENGFLETLPAGKTETGVWGGTVYEFGPIPISFPIPLAAPISEANTVIVPEGDTPPAECENPEHPGNAGVENPEAKPGFLCVYVGLIAEGTASEIQRIDANAPNGAGSTGAVVLVQATGPPSMGLEGFSHARGTWAVTAP